MASAPNTRGTQGQGRDPSLREGRPATPGSAPPAHGPRGARRCPATACEQLSRHPRRPAIAPTPLLGRHRRQHRGTAQRTEGSTGADLGKEKLPEIKSAQKGRGLKTISRFLITSKNLNLCVQAS